MVTVYLIPTYLHEEGLQCLPNYLLEAIHHCKVIFTENERTTRRYLKMLDSKIIIDDFEWHTINKNSTDYIISFQQAIKQQKTIAIFSEAGLPGIADPGQDLIAIAHQNKCIIKPLVGPGAIFLALMASGLNGQHFEFLGYIPIDKNEREKKIRQMEKESMLTGCTKIFIETPYRNASLIESLITNCNPQTKLCIGVNLTGPNEKIITQTISNWKKKKPDLQKMPAIFLINAKEV
ncbi:MAG: SAM-dependent methyltransferase [Ferruginibacter sp.]|nr:SAM-dependent methyltransferase [Ferruginibacter sp.]